MTESSNVTLFSIWAEAQALGFLGPGDLESHRHISQGFAQVCSKRPLRGIDLGSGAGVPGLALALWAPSQRWVLLDSMNKRCNFLREAVDSLGLRDRVDVAETRAERYARENLESFDVVTARGFGSPSIAVECAAPLLRLGGHCVISEPERTPERWKSAAAGKGLDLLGMTLLDSPPYFAVLRKCSATDATYPRREGVPKKRPLF